MSSRPVALGDSVRAALPLAVLGGGLAVRLVLALVVFPGQGLATDLGQFESWASTLARTGPGGFYAAAPSANYPPAYLYVLWLVGSLGGGVALLKLPAILADVAIGGLLYVAGRRWLGARVGLLAAALYLFIPVTWYDSALWGQVDAVGALVMLAAVVLLAEGWSEPAAALAVLAALVKPQDAVVLVVVLPVLLRRHLLRPGSGPVLLLTGRLRRLDRLLGSLVADQGPIRLASSMLAALLVCIAVLSPFDIARFAPASLADVPVLGQLAGVVGLVLSDTGQFSVLTANAFNLWALVGATPLASVIGSAGGAWTPDSLIVAGGLSAAAIGASLLIGTALLVAGGLLVRDGRLTVLLALTVIAFAFYALPTRVHERYLVPFFAPAALLAATALPALAGYVAVGVLDAVNLHTILADPGAAGSQVGSFGGALGRAAARGLGPLGLGGQGGVGGVPRAGGFGVDGSGFGPSSGGAGFGGASAIQLPFADIARSETAVALIAVAQTLGFFALLAAWLAIVVRPRALASRVHVTLAGTVRPA